MKKTQLGIKVKGFTGGIITGFVFSLLLFIGWMLIFIFHDQHIIFLIFAMFGLILSIWMGCVLFITIKKPKVLLEYDDNNIYFYDHKKTYIIELLNISDVKVFHWHDKYKTYDFGDITIIMKNNQIYKIGKIYDVDKVKKIIVSLINE